MYDIITIGSSLIDSFIQLNEFKLHPDGVNTDICFSYGSKVEVDKYLLRTGGGAGNAAVGFARMGFKVGIITEIGQDILAKIILDEFRKEFVSTNLVVSEKNENTGGSIILIGKDGGRTAMVHRGASSMLDPEDIPSGKISRADWVHLSSISGNLQTLELIFKLLKKANKFFSWNPGGRELKLIASGKINLAEVPCEILFVNNEEWRLIESVKHNIFRNFKYVVITEGKKGGKVYLDGEIEEVFESDQVKSVDDTGAGDAFAVGFVSAYLKGKNIDESCSWGRKNATSVVQHVGAKPGLLTIDKIKVHN